MSRFSTFNNGKTAIPTELTSYIIECAIADAQPLPLGGGVGTQRAYHPLASVSRDLRTAFLDIAYSPRQKSRGAAPTRLHIGEALEFDDLRTLAAFFLQGPGQDVARLRRTRFVSITYLDDQAAKDGRRRRTTVYAFEAFELLHASWHLMQVSWLQLCLPCSGAVSSVDDAGMWSLLKIRGLDHLTISGPHRCIAPQARAALKARTHRKKLFPWSPLGAENPGQSHGTALVERKGDQPPWQQQYQRLDPRYRYLQDRETVAARRAIQRAAYRKRQRRWPMLCKRRRRR